MPRSFSTRDKPLPRSDFQDGIIPWQRTHHFSSASSSSIQHPFLHMAVELFRTELHPVRLLSPDYQFMCLRVPAPLAAEHRSSLQELRRLLSRMLGTVLTSQNIVCTALWQVSRDKKMPRVRQDTRHTRAIKSEFTEGILSWPCCHLPDECFPA